MTNKQLARIFDIWSDVWYYNYNYLIEAQRLEDKYGINVESNSDGLIDCPYSSVDDLLDAHNTNLDLLIIKTERAFKYLTAISQDMQLTFKK